MAPAASILSVTAVAGSKRPAASDAEIPLLDLDSSSLHQQQVSSSVINPTYDDGTHGSSAMIDH